MDLRVHHVFKSLVISWTEEDLSVESLPCPSIVHDFIASVLVSKLMQVSGDVLDSDLHEWSCVSFFTLKASNLRGQTLNQVSNSHSRWDSVRVHNDVRNNSFLSEWHIFLLVSHSTCTFLPMS
jgi:hypothetical protein